jgi:hypothetical protein
MSPFLILGCWQGHLQMDPLGAFLYTYHIMAIIWYDHDAQMY